MRNVFLLHKRLEDAKKSQQRPLASAGRLFLLPDVFNTRRCFVLFCFAALTYSHVSVFAQERVGEGMYRRVGLMGEPSPEMAALAEHITLETGQTAAPAAKFWRGVFSGKAAQYDAARIAAARSGGANLARVTPFALPNVLQILADGTPRTAWDAADASLLAASDIGGVVISLSCPPALRPAVWQALVKATALRYGKDPKFATTRWEFAGTAAQAQERYADLTRTVREILPDAPIGFRCMAGNAADGAAQMAKFCADSKIPLDSFGWTVDSNADDAGQTTERIRRAFAKFPALKATRLLPDISLSEEANPAQVLTLAARLTAFAPTGGSNALLGAMFPLTRLTDSNGRRNDAGNALALLNRMGGNQINSRLDRAAIRCLATREPGKIRILLWREANFGNALALVRLHGLTAALGKGGVRIQRFTRPDSPDGATDTDTGDLELPIALGPRSVTLLEVTPAPASPFVVSLSAPQFTYNPGETIALTVTVRNNGKTAASPNLIFRSPIVGLFNSGNLPAALAAIGAGQTKTLRCRLFIPALFRGQNIALTAQTGAAQSSLQVQIRPALAVTLITPRPDQPRPGQIAQAQIRLRNRGALPLSVLIRPEHTPPQTVTVPVGAAGTDYTVDIALPVFDPGVYPVKIAFEEPESGETGEAVTAYVGVPALCRYAESPPKIDANLSEWAGAERLGMGRVEQTSGKAWGGPSNLSATAYTKWDANYFYFACDVADDVFTPPTSKATLTQADSVQFALSTNRNAPPDSTRYDAGDNEFALGLLPTGAVIVRLAGLPSPIGAGVPGAKVAVRRIGTHTLYEAAVPWAQIGGARPGAEAALGLAIRVNDRDGERFGVIHWNHGMENGRQPGRFPPLRLVR